jgi:putative endonuclease
MNDVRNHRYYVYIMASRSHNFYVGVTNDIGRRVHEHQERTLDSFTARYNIDRLVWYERYHYVRNAIAREKQIKNWRRAKKIALIESLNPTWQDLSQEWGKPMPLLRTDRTSLGSGAIIQSPPLGMTTRAETRAIASDTILVKEKKSEGQSHD